MSPRGARGGEKEKKKIKEKPGAGSSAPPVLETRSKRIPGLFHLKLSEAPFEKADFEE